MQEAPPAAASSSIHLSDQGVAPSAEQPARTADRTVTLMLAIAIAVGVGLRLKHYLAQQPYWHDEASLVLNVFQKSARELLGPLESAQAAPPGFLLVERGMHVLRGRSELAMRLPPLLASLAGLGLFALLAWRMLAARAPRVAVLLVALWACSERVIWHAAEAKQYSVDVLVTLALLTAALRETPDPSRRLLKCAAIAAVAMWFSYATAFVFGGISLALLPAMVRQPRGMVNWLGCNALFGASFLALYFVSVRDQQVSALYEYWAAGFVDFSRPWMIPVWVVRQLLGIANYAFDLAGPLLLLLAVIGGCMLWKQHRRQFLGVLVMPAALVLIASTLRQYPFSGSRLTLFLAPGIFLLAGFGLIDLIEWSRDDRMRKWLVLAVPGYLLAVAAWHVVVYIVHPPAHGDMRAAVLYVAARDEPGDIFYANKLPEFRCYWPEAPVRDAAELVDRVPDERFWVLLSYTGGRDEKVVAPLLKQLTPHARQLDAYRAAGASVFLFEAVRTADPTPSAP